MRDQEGASLAETVQDYRLPKTETRFDCPCGAKAFSSQAEPGARSASLVAPESAAAVASAPPRFTLFTAARR